MISAIFTFLCTAFFCIDLFAMNRVTRDEPFCSPCRSHQQQDNLQTPPRPAGSRGVHVEISPVLEAKYKKLSWQQVINSAAKLIDGSDSGENRVDEALDALWIKAHHAKYFYVGERYYSRSIFHLLAQANNKTNAQEIWLLLLEKFPKNSDSTRQNEQHYLEMLQKRDCFSCRNIHGTPLHIAIKNGNYKMVKWLVGLGIDVNYQCPHTSHGQNGISSCLFPPLHYALSLPLTRSRSQSSMKNIIQILLNAGSDPQQRTVDGENDTALHVGFRFCHPGTKLLAAYVSDLTKCNSSDNTPFHVLSLNPHRARTSEIASEFIKSFKKRWKGDDAKRFPNGNMQNRCGSTIFRLALKKQTLAFYVTLQNFRRWFLRDNRRQQQIIS